MSSFALPAVALLLSQLVPSALAQVTATGTNGVTNPAAPTLGSSLNQTSYSRLLSLNSYDDFCIFAPPTPGDTIGDTEGEEVAWCSKQRNDARLIPDGTITAVHYVKTPLYVQIQGFGNLTALNIQNGDEGGELDPHGATGLGNPVGGNVTSNVSGSDVFYQEWMNYVAFDSFCLRICTAENSTYSAAVQCQHTFDLMGCEWVMPGDYTEGTFTSCDGDSSYPPGVYPVGEPGSGTTSTFAQRYTGTYTDATQTNVYTVGYTVTPSSAYSIPATSNCVTYSTISNGVTGLAAAVNTASATATASSASSASMASGSSASATASASTKAASGSSTSAKTAAASGASSAAASASTAASTSAASSGAIRSAGAGFPLVGAAVTVVLVGLGAGAVFL